MVLRGLVAASTCLLLLATAAPVRGEPAEVEALIAKGNELRRAGTPGPALPYFQKAYELARTPRTTGQLGLAELAAGYPVEAEQHLATALESPNDLGIVKYRQMLKDALTMARSQIGELAVQGGPQGAEVLVDGRVVGTLPLAAPIKLASRTTEVLVRAPGHSERKEIVPIAGGQRHALTVALGKIAKPAEAAPVVTAAAAAVSPAPAAAPPTPLIVQQRPADSAEAGSGRRTAAWIVGAGALAAGGTGLVLHLAARANASDFSASCANVSGTVEAAPGGPLTVEQCQEHLSDWESYRRWSIVGYASGAALAVTAGILFWTSRPPSTPMQASPSARASVRCGPTPNGISCHGVF